MKHFISLLLLGLLCWTNVYATALTHSYDGSKTATENGTALQAAIDGASSGDELKVQAGTYVGNFTMKEGVNVSGGWNSTFDAQTDYATILDANESGRVVNQAEDFTTLTIWSNLTIQNGKETSTGGGGAWLCKNGQVKHCLIQDNTTTSYGGGVANNSKGSVLIDDCIIRRNKSTANGGGIRICGTVQNSLIERNTTSSSGDGGAAHLQTDGKMINCIVRLNSAGKNNGAIRVYGSCVIRNSLIYANYAATSCGGINAGGSNAVHTIVNNTIICNSQSSTTNSAYCGVVLSGEASTSSFSNNIVWGNKANGSVNGTQTSGIANINIYHNAIYNAQIGTNGIKLTTSNPGFVDVTNADTTKWDLTITYSSSLHNAGYNSAVSGSTDLAGLTRIVDGTVDIGAYECQDIDADRQVAVGEDLQFAINHTLAGNTVKVQAGTYYGNFTMKDGVNVSGGWNEDFTSQTDYATILDANESGRVVNQEAAFSTLTVWSNLTIQNGKFTTEQTDKGGAGVALFANGQVKHCEIRNNNYTGASGTCNGGGVFNNAYTDKVLVDDCYIHDNTASHGGGVRICGVMQNSIIENNTTTINAAGGVQLHYGGAMYNCIVRNNTGKDCGGVRLTGTKACTVANCLIAGNTAIGSAGGMSLENGIHYVYNNTIVGNKQSSSNPTHCGVRLNVGAALEFANNIVCGNKANDVVQESQLEINANYLSGQAAHFNNNAIVYSSDFGTNTILLTESPFADADYHLLPNSDLINSGNDSKSAGTTDLDGNPRKQGTIDRGCYELTKYSREVTEGRFGTICLPYAVPSGAIAGAQVYKVVSFATADNAGLLLEEVNTMAAGKPYFFMANADEVTFAYIAEGDAAAAGNENGLYGTIAGETVSGEGYYVLQSNLLCPTYNAATGEDVEINLAANRAYLKFSEVPDAGSAAPAPGRRVLGIQQAQNTPTAISNQQSAAGAQKVLRDGQLLIIRDGKTYSVLGL
ncbi:MAG: hypothetical protein J6T76_05440 [Paludibacteraceae bacterium]|nr:hypothetical protein [Paludibacteraceae bacterium]